MHLERLGTSRKLFALAIILFAVFYIKGYLMQGVYYTPYLGGFVGDNYMYLDHAIENQGYFIPHHLFFPFVPAQIFGLAKMVGLFSESDPLYLEKAVTFFSLPNRVFVLVGLGFIFLILRRMGLTRLEALMGVFFVSTTFGCWFFTLQSNAIGFLLSLVVVALFAVILALESRKNYLFVLSALLTSLCIYTHISSFYSVLAIGMSVCCVCMSRWLRDKSVLPIVNLGVFVLTAATMALFFYYLMVQYFGRLPLDVMLDRMADLQAHGIFAINLSFFERLFGDGISTNVLLVVGLIQSGEKTAVEVVVITLQLSFLLLIILSLKELDYKKLFEMERNIPLLVIGLTFFGTWIGFSIREMWLQYYSPISPISAIFLLSLVFSRTRITIRKGYNHIVVSLLILCMIYINGFGSANVLKGTDIRDNACYRTLDALAREFPGRKVYYFGRRRDDLHNFQFIRAYYTRRGKYSRIVWREPIPLGTIISDYGKQGSTIVLNMRDYPDIETLVGQGIGVRRILLDGNRAFRLLLGNGNGWPSRT